MFDQQTIKTKLCRKKENSRKKKIANKQCDQKLQFFQNLFDLFFERGMTNQFVAESLCKKQNSQMLTYHW